jgi:signal transduction histidine kinase
MTAAGSQPAIHYGRLTLFFAGFALLEFFYKYLDYVANGYSINPLHPFLEEMTGVFGVLPLYVLLLRPMALRFRPDLTPWTRWLPTHLGVMLLFSVLHTSSNWGTRLAIWRMLGLGSYNYGKMPVRFLMELPSDVILYSMGVAFVIALARMKEGREREMRIVRLENDLATAQLDALALQLQPHFLFNALNAVSAAIYEDPRRADIMLARVADFLRHMLQRSPSQEIALEQELQIVKLYLEVMKARFEENLKIEWHVDPSLCQAAVPQLILQPIVENAIRHGVAPGSNQVSIELGVAAQNGSLLLWVRDHGKGVSHEALTPGIGLGNTRSRLERLYGSAAHLDLENAPGGGTEVRIALPYRLSRIA